MPNLRHRNAEPSAIRCRTFGQLVEPKNRFSKSPKALHQKHSFVPLSPFRQHSNAIGTVLLQLWDATHATMGQYFHAKPKKEKLRLCVAEKRLGTILLSKDNLLTPSSKSSCFLYQLFIVSLLHLHGHCPFFSTQLSSSSLREASSSKSCEKIVGKINFFLIFATDFKMPFFYWY